MDTPPPSPFGVSILDMVGKVRVRDRSDVALEERAGPSLLALAYSEPTAHPSGILPHVFEAHEEAKRRVPLSGEVDVSVTVLPEIGALEAVLADPALLREINNLPKGVKFQLSWRL
jgi:hypothetical protein